jgi:hypothetical protein
MQPWINKLTIDTLVWLSIIYGLQYHTLVLGLSWETVTIVGFFLASLVVLFASFFLSTASNVIRTKQSQVFPLFYARTLLTLYNRLLERPNLYQYELISVLAKSTAIIALGYYVLGAFYLVTHLLLHFNYGKLKYIIRQYKLLDNIKYYLKR